MAQLSRNQRHKARQRRNISLLSRQVREMQAAHLQTHLSLLAVLVQQGGKVTVTKGTFEQVVQGIRTLNWQRVASEVPGEFTVQLVEPKEETSSDAPESKGTALASKVKVTRLPDDVDENDAQQVAAAIESIEAENSPEGDFYHD